MENLNLSREDFERHGAPFCVACRNRAVARVRQPMQQPCIMHACDVSYHPGGRCVTNVFVLAARHRLMFFEQAKEQAQADYDKDKKNANVRVARACFVLVGGC